MGIPGLFSLVMENSEQLLRPTVLSNRGLVLDGGNVCNHLYFHKQSEFDCIYGGEYRQFEQIVLAFFKSLLQAKIELLVMWDAPYNKDHAKLRTKNSISKQEYRISRCVSLSRGGKADVLPLQAYPVFLNVMKSLNIRYCLCTGNSDAFIAYVANCLGWPVLSDDSDFFIYDLDFGCIPLSLLKWQTLTNGSLNAAIYHVENLLKLISNTFQRDLLPLFAAISGNSYSNWVTAVNCSEFVAQLNAPTGSTIQRLNWTAKHRCLIALLEWLSEKSLDEAVKEILTFVQSQSTEQNLVELLFDVMDMYNCHKLDKNAVRCVDDVVAIVGAEFEKNNIGFPRWFVDSYVCCQVNSFFLGIAVQKHSILPCLVEDFSRPSAYVCSTSIRRFLYTILCGTGGSVTEISRNGKQLAKTEIPCSVVDSDVTCPELSNVSEWSLERRRDILFTAARFDTQMRALLQNLLPSDELFVLSIVFWLISNDTAVEQTDCLALLINYTRPVDLTKFNYSTKIGQTDQQQCHWRLLHVFAQWQTVIDALISLNNVLMKPMQVAPFADMYNGRVVFNVAYYLFLRNESLKKALSNMLKDSKSSGGVERFYTLRNRIAVILHHYHSSERSRKFAMVYDNAKKALKVLQI